MKRKDGMQPNLHGRPSSYSRACIMFEMKAKSGSLMLDPPAHGPTSLVRVRAPLLLPILLLFSCLPRFIFRGPTSTMQDTEKSDILHYYSLIPGVPSDHNVKSDDERASDVNTTRKHCLLTIILKG